MMFYQGPTREHKSDLQYNYDKELQGSHSHEIHDCSCHAIQLEKLFSRPGNVVELNEC